MPRRDLKAVLKYVGGAWIHVVKFIDADNEFAKWNSYAVGLSPHNVYDNAVYLDCLKIGLVSYANMSFPERSTFSDTTAAVGVQIDCRPVLASAEGESLLVEAVACSTDASDAELYIGTVASLVWRGVLVSRRMNYCSAVFPEQEDSRSHRPASDKQPVRNIQSIYSAVGTALNHTT
jgi:hypothetical protein